MCQSILDGGRRCPSHRHDTRELLYKAVEYPNRYGYGSKLYHDMFLDLRRTYRGVRLTEGQIEDLTRRVRARTNRATGDGHVADNATLQAQVKLLDPRKMIPDDIDDKLQNAFGRTYNRDEPRKVFSYIYSHLDEFEEPTPRALRQAKRDLGDSPLSRLPQAVRAFAIIQSDASVFKPPMSAFIPTPSQLASLNPRIVDFVPVSLGPGNFAQVGYSPAGLGINSRLEMVLNDEDQTRVTYQNVSERRYQELMSGGASARSALHTIRSNPNSRYASQEESDAAGVLVSEGLEINRCTYCGQFVDRSFHRCPEKTVKTELAIKSGTYIEEDDEQLFPHTALDGSRLPSRSVLSLPTLTPVEDIEVGVGATLDDYQHMLGRTSITHLLPEGLDYREVRIKTVRRITPRVFEIFRESESIPFDYDNEDVVIFSIDSGVYNFISYVRRVEGQTLVADSSGVYVQRTGRDNPENWVDEIGYQYAGISLYSQDEPEEDRLTQTPFPSVYELSNLTASLSDSDVSENQDWWELPDQEQMKEAFESTPVVSIFFKHRMIANSQGAFIDHQGYAFVPPRSSPSGGLQEIFVEGRIQIEKTIDGKLKVTGHDHSSCSHCREAICSHEGYSVRQVPHVLHKILGITDQESYAQPGDILPVSLSSVCSVEVRDDNTKNIHFDLTYDNRRICRLSGHPESETAMDRLTSDKTITAHPTRILRAMRLISSGDTISLPIETSFQNLPESAFDSRQGARVKGVLTYIKDDAGKVSLHERSLQCSCEVYERNYTCRHTRLLEERHERLLDPIDPRLERRRRHDPTFSSFSSTDLEGYTEGIRVQDRAEALREEVPALEQAIQQSEQEWRLTNQQRVALRDNYTRVIHAERIERERLENLALMAGYADQRAKMKSRYSPENFEGTRYADDYAAFSQEITLVKQKISRGEDPLVYETSSVLNGIGDAEEHARKFGVELEVVFPDSFDSYGAREAVARELAAAELSAHDFVGGYHSGRRAGWDKWTAEDDTTVDLEIVSPIMHDTPEHWSQLQQVCDIIKSNGGSVNYQTGSHVHISTGDYGNNVATHAALLDEFSRYSDILYRLGSNPETKTHRGTEWCRPNVTQGSVSGSGQREANYSIASYLQAPHSTAVNFDASGVGAKSHAEVRLWDGSLNPKVVQMQVMLTAAMTEVASQRVNHEDEDVFTYSDASEQLPLGTGKATIFESKEKETAKFREMLDRYFPRESDRKRFIALWETTKWQTNQSRS